MALYYYAGEDSTFSAYEIKRRTGLDPESGIGPEALVSAGIYGVTDAGDPNDPDFYTVSTSYSINGYVVDVVYTPTPIALGDAKTVGVKKAKQKAQTYLEAIGVNDGFGPIALIAAAAQNASSRSTETQTKLDDVAQVLAAMLTNIADINAAADVPAIEAILDDPARDTQALTAAQQKAIDGDDAAFGGIFSLSDGLTDAADDTAAGAAGVAVNQLYRNGSVVQIRVS